ncbi:MAG: VCBS repeat-containing protein, partial [Acidobacteriota bacterium]
MARSCQLANIRRLFIVSLILIAGTAAAQVPQPVFPPWIQFTDQTSTRLNLLPGGLNDTWEKDIATGDLDQDGRTDVVVVRKKAFSFPGAASDLLLMNLGGVLTDSTALFAPGFYNITTDARDVVIDDFDLDGWLDVVVATTFVSPQPNALQQLRYYRNLGRNAAGNWLGLRDESAVRIPLLDLSMPPLNSKQQFCAVASGDLTGDGLPELYLTNYDKTGTAVDVLLHNIGFGLFQDASAAMLNRRNSAFGTGVELVDIDGDGDRDVIKTSAQHPVAPWN